MHILSQVKMFEGLTDADLAIIHHVAVEKTAGEGQEIFQENSPGDKFYVLVEGVVEIVIANPLTQKEQISLAKLTDLEVFGEFCLFDNSPRSATARVLADCRFLEFDRVDLTNLFDQKPRIGMVVMKNVGKILCSRLRNTDLGLRNSLLWIGMTNEP